VHSPVIWVKGTLPLPETNSHGKPTTKLNKLKTLKTLDLGVSLQGTTTFKKTTTKSADSGSPNPCQFVSENGFFL
jgi:hypothetical protein